MNDARITVLMPAWNAGHYIAEAISSVLSQLFKDFELLIINDGSTDNTKDIIHQFKDERIRLINTEHQGIAAALNRGLYEARGDFIARFDADDLCFPARLQKQIDFLEEHNDYVLVGCDAEYISESGEHLFDFNCREHSHKEIVHRMRDHCPFIHSGVMYRKTPVIQAGGYCMDAHNFEDHLLWTQLSAYGKYCNLPEKLIKVRFNPQSATIDEKWRGRRFRSMKKKIIRRGYITQDEGRQILDIIRNQDMQKIKQGAYYALCGKKFLLNNHQPAKARTHFIKAIRSHPLRLDNYALYLLSFLPQPFVNWLHQLSTAKHPS